MSRTWLPKLWKQIIGRTTRSQARRRKSRLTRPGVENLDDRTTPTGLQVTSVLDLPVYFGSTGNLLPINVGTLRYELTQANIDAAHGISDTISFSFTTPQTIWLQLQLGQLELSGGAGSITINGSNLVTINGLGANRIFQVDPGVHATLSGLTIKSGNASAGNGGGILDEGVLTLNNNCNLIGNSAYNGGAIYNMGTLIVNPGTFFGANTANNMGGAIYNNGSATLTDVIIASISPTGALVGSNSAVYGGGIYNASSLPMTIAGCDINFNTAHYGGGIYNQGIATVSASEIIGNSASQAGGGIYNNNGGFFSLGLHDTNVSSNVAPVCPNIYGWYYTY
jgi:hypothetical protein